MKIPQLILLFTFLSLISCTQENQEKKVSWVSSTQDKQWQTQVDVPLSIFNGTVDVEILMDRPLQEIEGFGTCFNELGWESLSLLSDEDREQIMEELFAPNKGANFTICRMPLGANDFSKEWYSYNETEGDFEMRNFSIANDLNTLVPYIKNALKYYPKLKIWASPWSPPVWMKRNKHYASRSSLMPANVPDSVKTMMRDSFGMDLTGIDNGLKPGQEAPEGTDNFIQEDTYFEAYSLYFSKFIEAYRDQGIDIAMVMPQNEFNSDQVFPSCTWTAKGLNRFLEHLVPTMKAQNVDVFFGTMERPDHRLVDTILNNPKIKEAIKGVGFQWAGKESIAQIHRDYPEKTLYQTEQECGNGYNDWAYCTYAWGLMKHYLKNGTNAYMYWNTSLKEGGRSTWGWHQNSLVSVDTTNNTYKYNYEYYLLKHVSHYVKPGARRLETKGGFEDILAFENKDKSVAIVLRNESPETKTLHLRIGTKVLAPTLKADSYNTIYIQ